MATPKTAPKPAAPLDGYNFSSDPAVDEWTVPARKWLDDRGATHIGLGASAQLFDPAGRMLLLRRAPHDSFGAGRWESPGGSVEWSDRSVLHGCARELWEESGLVLRRVEREITGGTQFTVPGTTDTVLLFTFQVDAADGNGGREVRIDPDEHIEWRWATEEEVREERMADGTEMGITTPEIKGNLLLGFQTKRNAKIKAGGELFDG